MGAGRAYGSILDTLSLCKDAAVLTHQSTVRKCRRLCQGPEYYHMLCQLPLCIERPSAASKKGVDCLKITTRKVLGKNFF